MGFIALESRILLQSTDYEGTVSKVYVTRIYYWEPTSQSYVTNQRLYWEDFKQLIYVAASPNMARALEASITSHNIRAHDSA
jgi:hypothetical protein